MQNSFQFDVNYCAIIFSENFLSLEKPVETAMLVSVTGVKCLMANQWHCTLAENANRLKVSMKGTSISLTLITECAHTCTFVFWFFLGGGGY